MRILGIDYGEKRIGVSISDPFLLFANDLEVINRLANSDLADVLSRFRYLINEYEVKLIVLGFPKNMNNTVGTLGDAVIKFKGVLEEYLNIPVELWDERLSSALAENILLSAGLNRKKRRQVIDKVSAVVILQSYLDCQQNKIKKNTN